MTNAFINDYRKRQRDPVIMLMGGSDQLPGRPPAGAAPGQAGPGPGRARAAVRASLAVPPPPSGPAETDSAAKLVAA